MVKWQIELSPKIIWLVKLEERALLQLVIIFGYIKNIQDLFYKKEFSRKFYMYS